MNFNGVLQTAASRSLDNFSDYYFKRRLITTKVEIAFLFVAGVMAFPSFHGAC